MKEKVLDFLSDLRENNSKEWMDQNRSRYFEAKEIWLDEIEKITQRLSKHDKIYENVNPKKTISRINTNRRFHQNKPIYKDFFTCQPAADDYNGGLLFICISPNKSFIGGGLWKPDKQLVEKVREAIDYDGEKLLSIIEDSKFQNFFGGLAHDPDKLKTAPQNYSIEHEQIELLRYKNYTAQRSISDLDFTSSSFIDTVEEAYITLSPFSEYLKKAIHFND